MARLSLCTSKKDPLDNEREREKDGESKMRKSEKARKVKKV